MWNYLKRRFARKPDFVVGDPENPYLLRWWIIPRNRFFNVYLHKFVRDDDDRALHDHPWWSVSLVMKGGYFDITPDEWRSTSVRWVRPGSIVVRSAKAAHRIMLRADPQEEERHRQFMIFIRDMPGVEVDPPEKQPAWTLFITGPRVREWGFHCPQGWRHWREFTDGVDGSRIGKGCD